MSLTAGGLICPYPFSRMESPGAPFISCCRSWLTDEFLALETGEDAWNGPAAQALRASVLDGSYRFCRRDRCGTQLSAREEFLDPKRPTHELPMSPANLAAMLEGSTYLPEGPTALTVMGDPRCNLACGSCRKEPILQESSETRLAAERTAHLLATHGKTLKILKLAGDGEVFFSPALRQILAGLNAEQFPRLEKVDVLTNGLLCDEETFARLEPGSQFVRSLNVSVDAGDEATYRRVRGGDWERLRRNLDWMAGERQRNRFDFLGLTYVVRAENFRSLPAFLDWADTLGVDEVYVSQLYEWDRMAISFREEAVHLASHADHQEFLTLWDGVRAQRRSFRWRTNLP